MEFLRFRVDAKYQSIMIGEKKPCYVTRLNVMRAFYAFFTYPQYFQLTIFEFPIIHSVCPPNFA